MTETAADPKALEAERDELRTHIGRVLRNSPSELPPALKASVDAAEDRLAEVEKALTEIGGG